MAKRNPAAEAEAERLAVFLVNLAIDSGKRHDFETSPEAAMSAAGLSASSVAAVKAANQAELVNVLINLQSGMIAGSKTRRSRKKKASKKRTAASKKRTAGSKK
jgi:hypothetical protein